MLRNSTVLNLPGLPVCIANLPGHMDPAVAVAAARAGATGVLNVEFSSEFDDCERAIREAVKQTGNAAGKLAFQLDPNASFSSRVLDILPGDAPFVVLSFANAKRSRELTGKAAARGIPVVAQVTSEGQAADAVRSGCAVLIAKGYEAAGLVGEESTFVLIQRLRGMFDVPIWAQGGVGLYSVAACLAAGASGVVLDSQVLLASDAPTSAAVRRVLERFEADDTVCLGSDAGILFRALRKADTTGVLEAELITDPAVSGASPAEQRALWLQKIEERIGWLSPNRQILPLGQDASFAGPLAAAYGSIAGIVRAFEQSARESLRLAKSQKALGRGSDLARSHNTEYPILQGPMTRVSDTAEFASEVARGGGLPFLALALLRAPECKVLLEKTRDLLADRPWGVGILGFVSPELRAEQLAAVNEIRPKFALIAGGRPDQARHLEQNGIATYLHVPAPGLLKLFLADGARRFVFEGRECGGHVGPRTSFVLWDTMVRCLIEACDAGVRAEELHIIFAGGIHDAGSAAAVAALAAPLVARGARIGVLMGTAYLFTHEAVSSGAIVEGFQQQALQCTDTVVLESGPGHATRCVNSAFADSFRQYRMNLLAEGRPTEEVRAVLEDFNVGRLRVASKGITRVSDDTGERRFRSLSQEEQSAEGMYMIGQVAALRSAPCSIRDLHAEVSAGSVEWLDRVSISEERNTAPPRWSERPCDVAIVGMSCILPKAADLRAFWKNTLAGIDAITPIPEDRFDTNVFFDTDKKAQDKFYSRVGGFIGDVPFDPVRYGIPPNTLSSIDPTQLLMLISVEEALRDAGYQQRAFPRERTSVIFGFSGGLGELGINYALRATLPKFAQTPPALFERLPLWTEDSFAGILPNVGAGRVANRLDLSGVNFTVDAACASSLAAVYVAARELVSGDSDMVLTGGIDTGQNSFGYQCFATAQALSAQGSCRPFDASADGIAISEGISVVVLKRLSDAERDGDRIYAVLKGIAGSSDGRGRSMTAPRREGQMLALRRAYQHAQIEPATVGMIEAHGTGTVAGDAAELNALNEVFRSAGAAPHTCAVGSIKSMVGHTKAAAGVTGMIKSALSLYHRVLPPTLHVEQPNAALRDPATPFFVVKESQPWVSATPRRAGVSSFGFGGTNFHAVLEEHVAAPPSKPLIEDWPCELFAWKTASPESLIAALESTLNLCGETAQLKKLAAEVCSRWFKGSGSVRLAIVSSSIAQLKSQIAATLEAIRSGKRKLADEPAGVYFGTEAAGKIAFLLPGQGSQYPGMLRELALHFSEFTKVLETADEALGWRLHQRVYPPPAFSAEEEKRQIDALTDTAVAQPALGAVNMAATALLRRFGITPDMAAGHSYGEYAALCATGAISVRSLIRISEERGKAIKDGLDGEAGVMAAVLTDGETTARLTAGIPGVTLANYNSPSQTVIGGPAAAIEAASRKLEQAGLTVRKVAVACAFHTSLMSAARERLARFLATVEFRAPRTPVFSNMLGTAHGNDPQQILTTLSEHLVSPVRWVDNINAMYSAGARVFVEAGPKAILSGLARQILGDREAAIVPLDSPARPGIKGLLFALAQLHACGADVQVEELLAGRMRPEAASSPAAPGWMVNPARVFRAGETVRPLPRMVLTDAAAAPPAAAPLPSPAAAAPIPVNAAPPVPADPAADAVVLHFQQLMSEFLQTQTAVMTAYLGGTSSPAAGIAQPAIPVAVMQPAISSPAPLPAVVSPAASRIAAPAVPELLSPVASVASADDVRSELLHLVSERTGYPTDILDGSASLEADLGIDSIKRVEILGAYIRTRSESEQTAIRAQMDRLTGARTLNAIIDVITALRADGKPVAVAAPTAPPVIVRRDISAEMIHLLSERTGYPPEILDPNASLEADLGVDSIKRVEFLGAFRQSLSAPDGEALANVMEKLTRARTLGEIIRTAESALTGSPGPESLPAPAAPTASVRQGTPTFRLRLKELTEPKTNRAFPERVTVVTDDETGLAEAIVDRLRARGEKPVLLRHSGDPALTAGNVICADLTSYNAISRVLKEIREQYGPVGAILHLLPCRAEAHWTEADLDRWREMLALDVQSAYALARASQEDLTAAGLQKGALFAVFTARGGHFGLQNGQYVSPSHNALADFVKTLALEFEGIRCKVLDLDPSDPMAVLLEKITQELQAGDDVVQIGRPGDRRVTVVPEELTNVAVPGSGSELGRDSVILLTGGARGITAGITRALAVRYKPTLVLAGMSPLPSGEEHPELSGVTDAAAAKAILLKHLREKGEAVRPVDVEHAWARIQKNREILDNIAACRAAGARVDYVHIDVRDASAFSALIDRVRADYGRIDAVVHGAGTIEDKLIRDKTPESYSRVVDTKAISAFVLARKIREGSIGSAILMSSVTAALGNRAQADYAAANGVLNGLALSLTESGHRVVALNWGPWDQAGMVSAAVREQFVQRGVQLIPIDEGVEIVLNILAAGTAAAPLIVVGDGPWSTAGRDEEKFVRAIASIQ